MSDHDLPSGTVNDAPLSFDEGVEQLADFLDDPETDLDGEDQEHEQAGDTEGDEPDEELADLDDEDQSDEEDEGSGDYDGGKFAADNAKVRLDDGSTITIAELKRNNLYQRDYTHKTTELSEQRREFDATRERVNQVAAQIASEREFLLSVYSQVIPKQPDPSMMEIDPIGYMQAKESFDRRISEFGRLQQMSHMERQRRQQEETQQSQQVLASEREKLLEAMPDLKDERRFESFKNDALSIGVEHYGFTADEFEGVDDHRYLRVLRDAMAYRKLKAKAGTTKQELAAKPKLLSSKRRPNEQAKTSREKRDRESKLRSTGSFDAGVAALMDLDL